MSRYKRIILLAGFFSFIGVGFSNGLLFKKNTLLEEVVEYDEVIRKVKKVQRKPASIHSKRHKTVVTAGELPFAKEIANPEVQASDSFEANNENFEDNSISGSAGGNSATPSQAYYPQGLGQGIPTDGRGSHAVAPTVAAASSIPTTSSSSANLGGGGGMSFGNVNTGDSNSNQGSGVSIYKVKSIQMKSGKLVVQGSNLHTVKNITLKSNNNSIALSKVSASSSELVAMGFDTLKLITGKVYSLIIADAYGSSTYPISIELADGAVTMRKLAPLGASEDGYILKWDASSQSWIAAPDDVGAGPDGGITSITKGSGIIGEGTSITTVGSIAVNVGTGVGQIPQFDADKKLVLQSENRMSFTENAEEFVFGMFAEVFKLRNQANDTDIFAVVGNDFLVRGQQVCLSDGTNCPTAGAAVDSISVSAPLTQSGTTSVSLGLAIDNTTIGLNGSSQLSIPNAAITANKLHQMGAAPNQVLKWNGAAWAPAADVDTGITAESDPTVRKFARNDLNGIAPTACGADESMTYASALDTLVCQAIEIDASQVTGLNQFWASATGGINYAGGRVGIGTTTPSTKLQVVDGVINATGSGGFFQAGNDTLDANLGKFSFHASHRNWTDRYWTGLAYNGSGGAFYIGGGDALNLFLDSGNSVNYGSHIFRKVGWNGTNRTYTESMRIDSTGRVGIGTASPEAGLHVQSPRWNTDASAPQLGIVGSRAALGFYDNNQTGANVFVLENGEEQFHLYSTTHTANDWGYDEKVSRLTVLGANGNVGIGVTSPTTKLEVNGIVKATGFQGPMTSTSVSSGTGTATAPAYTFSNSTNTGFFSTSAGSIGISSGGAQTFNFNSYGLLSITPGGASVNSSNGTAGSPTFSFSGDADTGWFRPGADTMAASTGGVERMRISSIGNVGVGTVSPTSKMTVEGTSNILMIRNPDTNDSFTGGTMLEIANTGINTTNKYISFVSDKDGDQGGEMNFGDMGLGANNSLRMSNPSGNAVAIQPSGGSVGIGTTNPNVLLDVRGNVQVGNSGNSSNTNWPFVISSSSGLGWKVDDGAGLGKFELYTGHTGLNQMRLLNGVSLLGHMQDLILGATGKVNALTIKQTTGNIGIDVNSPSEKLEVAGNVKAQAYLYTSDARLKKNVKTYDNALVKILALRGVKFDWIESDEAEVGFIAQEVEDIEPDLVVTSSVDGIKAVKYANMVAILVEAFKEQNKVIEENKKLFLTMHKGLESRVRNLEREVASLREENERLKEDLELIKKHLKIK